MGGPAKFPAGYIDQARELAAQGHRVTIRIGRAELTLEPSGGVVQTASAESGEDDTCAGKFGRRQ